MQVLLAQEYIHRVLFVLEHNGQYINVYRSSGLSGTGHAGQILPFSSLALPSYESYRRSNVGYIYKEMFYKDRWINHGKDLLSYPNVYKKMLYLHDFLEDINPASSFDFNSNVTEEGEFDILKWNQYVIDTTKAIDTAIDNRLPFDLYLDF